jgi:hypothetical protein
MRKTFSIFLIVLVVFTSVSTPSSLLCNAQASIISSKVLTSDTTWTRDASPYNLTGPIAVGKGVTLKIEAGTTIILNKNYIQVNGTLTAVGSKSSPINIIGGFGGSITFTSESTDWDKSSETGCTIEYTNFNPLFDQYGYSLGSAQITVDNSSPNIAYTSNVTIEVKGGSPTIVRNVGVHILVRNGLPQITNNELDGLDCFGGSPIISFNTIQNGIRSDPTYHLEDTGSPIIANNNITAAAGNEGAVVDLLSNGYSIVSNNNITGLYKPTYYDSYGRPMGGGQYTAYGISMISAGLLANNNISGCKTSSIIASNVNLRSKPIIGIQNNTLHSSGLTVNGLVSITLNYNNIEGGVILTSRATTNVDASYNWWGTVDTSAIDDAIVDSAEDYNLGKVYYLPILTSPNHEAVPNFNAPLPISSPTASTVLEVEPSANQDGEVWFGFNWVQTAAIALVTGVVLSLVVIAVILLRKKR